MKHIGRGLIIKTPWSDFILDGRKTWEIRGSRTNIRGKIDIIESGTSTCVGTVELIDCIGPLSLVAMMLCQEEHLISIDLLTAGLPYPNTYAWVVQNPVRFKKPVPYNHPNGAVIWVKL